MKTLLLAALLLLPFPASAQPLQFGEKTAEAPRAPTLAPGLNWLTHQPVTLFDLGLMELTRQASQQMQMLTGVGSAVAEYREDLGLILISLYPATTYREDACEGMIQQLRQMIFPQYKDRALLEAHLASFFSNYGPQAAGRPITIGAELLPIVHMVMRMQGGGCQLTLQADKAEHHVDPGFVSPEAPKPEADKAPAREAAKP